MRGDDLYDFRSGEGLDEGDRRLGCLTESGEAGLDLLSGEPGGDLAELLGLCGVLGPSPADGAEEY